MEASHPVLEQIVAGGSAHAFARLSALGADTDVTRLPYTLRVLLENVVRAEVLGHGSPEEVRAVAEWDAKAEPRHEISFRPARVSFTSTISLISSITGGSGQRYNSSTWKRSKLTA